MLERIFLAVLAVLSDWLKNQDGKIILLFSFFVISTSYLYNEKNNLNKEIEELRVEIDSLRVAIIDCELHRAQLEIIVRNLERNVSDKNEKNKTTLEGRTSKNGVARRR